MSERDVAIMPWRRILSRRRTLRLRDLVLALAFLFGVIYLPDAGHGFVKDDFQWIDDARQPLSTAFTTTSGFYRPLVTLSFRANYELFGLDSYPYGLTNVALAAVCAVLVFKLARSFGLGVNASTFGAAIWAFNFHGINMSILWLSGRTALLLTLFSLLAGVTFITKRKVWCLVCITAALLSKEEAILLPLTLLLWHLSRSSDALRQQRWTTVIREVWWLMMPLPLYVAARLGTNAMMPYDAPDHYRFTFALFPLAHNFLEYADRSWTFPIAGLVLIWCVARPMARVDQKQYQVAVCGVAWFVCGLAITGFVPVRSSLYACWPSAGAALACAAVADGWMERVSARQLRRAGIASVLALIALVPIYRLRNERWVEIADLSAQTMAAVQRCSRVRCDSIVLEDDLLTRRNFTSTFGTFERSARLFLGRDVPARIIPGPVESTGLATADVCLLHVQLNNSTPHSQLVGPCD